jgi:hypothetical protein
MGRQIPPEFVIGARVRVTKVQSSSQDVVGKIGTITRVQAAHAAVIVTFDDGSARACFVENLELAADSGPASII